MPGLFKLTILLNRAVNYCQIVNRNLRLNGQNGLGKNCYPKASVHCIASMAG